MQKRHEVALEGCSVSSGIAIGIPFVLDVTDTPIPEVKLASQDVHKEITRYRQALKNSRLDLLRIKEELIREGVQEGVFVLEAHLQMIEDPLLGSKIEEDIKKTKKNAEFVFQQAINRVKLKFESLSDPFFRQRFEDIRDISKRILAYLREMKRLSLEDVPKNSIIFTHSLSPSDVAMASKQRVEGFVTQVAGGSSSHTAIVAKAKGIPYVASIDFRDLPILYTASMCIVDGNSGKIIINPTEKTLIQFRHLKLVAQQQQQVLQSRAHLPTQTQDGIHISLQANVESDEDFNDVIDHRADGVGLFRSEFIVLERGIFPSEEEQVEIYKKLVTSMQDVSVVIRAFDVGFDKVACALDRKMELNPALGVRAIRFLLQEKELLRVQLRAIMRASLYGNVKILLPMISNVGELIEAKEVLQSVIKELECEGYSFPNKVPVGCMIEVPSAAMCADLLAQECDFLSIGTNDLTQYTLAIDRTNQRTNESCASLHPGVIRLMKFVLDEAAKYHVPVSVCGEIASDPCVVPFLIGLGITQLSVSCRFLPIIRHVIRSTHYSHAQELARQVMLLRSSNDIHQMLESEYEKHAALVEVS